MSRRIFELALKSLVPAVAFRRPRPPCEALWLFSANDITETDSVSDRTVLLQSLLQLRRQGGGEGRGGVYTEHEADRPPDLDHINRRR